MVSESRHVSKHFLLMARAHLLGHPALGHVDFLSPAKPPLCLAGPFRSSQATCAQQTLAST